MSNKGFTLAEVMIALAVSSVIMIGVYATVNMTQLTSSGMEGRIIAQQDVRAALDLMTLEIRMASYDSSLDNSIWRNPVGCNTPSPNPAYKGIQIATPNSIMIQMDINDNTTISGSEDNEIITYTYDAPNMRITRALAAPTNCGAAQSFIGDTPASGRPRVVRIVNDLNGNNAFNAGDVPLFRYFDHNNVEIQPANLPANIPSIRTIEITIVAETENIDPATKTRKRIVYSLRTTPKNHGLNPGVNP